MIRRLILALGLIGLIASAARGQTTQPAWKTWKLIFSDEFEGKELDHSKWAIGLPWPGTDGEGRHHNVQYASYIMDHNVVVEDGKLKLLTRREDVSDKKGRTFHFTEGLITTAKSFRHRYGYWEARVKIPIEAGPGLWPAFWTLAESWPPEMDICEVWTSTNRNHQGLCYRPRGGGREKWDDIDRRDKPLPAGFNTFGMEWGPGYQIYNVNGEITKRVKGDHVPNDKHYILLNSGADARNPPTSATVFPNAFEVDYVRVYERPDMPASQAAAPIPVTIKVDAAKNLGPLKPIWRFFGADEPNYAYMKDGQKLLRELGELRPQNVYFRTHNLLNTGDGTPALKWGSTNVYTEDASGNPIYDWTIVDRIFDTYRERGVRPFAQIGFMPEALSTHPQPYRHEWRPGLPYKEIVTGWAYPPKNYNKWRELVTQWVKHCVERYGKSEVEQWYWEVWNEANGSYWQASPQEWYKLYDYAIDGVRRALPTARVGGPHSAGSGGKFTRDFLEHCLREKNFATGETGTPLDFVAFHAKGAPTFVDNHVRMGIAEHLRTIDAGFKIVADYPELKNKPIVIGESDPEGCAACQGPQLSYRSGTMYSSYTAASFARKHMLAERNGVNLEGALTWAFEFEDQRYFAGFRALASNGIDLPVLNVFRMFSKMSGNRVAVSSSSETPLDQILKEGVRGDQRDISALASSDGTKLFILAWHYHDDDVPGPDAAVELQVSGLSGDRRITEYRIDSGHSNAHALWTRMGSPLAPTREQYDQLKQAGQLVSIGPASDLKTADGTARLNVELPRQAVILFVVE